MKIQDTVLALLYIFVASNIAFERIHQVMFNAYIYFSSYKRHNVLSKSRKQENIDFKIYAHMMAFILSVSHCPVYYTSNFRCLIFLSPVKLIRCLKMKD